MSLEQGDRVSVSAICVFCGSSIGNDPAYAEAARSLGTALAKNGIELVYGAGTRGLMGATAKATFLAGGRVHGVTPNALAAYERREADTEFPVELLDPTPAGQADAASSRSVMTLVTTFVCLPGGLGTFEEAFEMVTWTQLGIHQKPVILLDVNGFYSPIKALLQGAVADGFVRAENASFMTVLAEPVHGDWGRAAIEAAQNWTLTGTPYDLRWNGLPKQKS